MSDDNLTVEDAIRELCITIAEKHGISLKSDTALAMLEVIENRLAYKIHHLTTSFEKFGMRVPDIHQAHDDELVLSGRFCPDCGGVTIILTTIKAKNAFMTKGERPEQAVNSVGCLTCSRVFVMKAKKNKKGDDYDRWE